MKNNISPVLPKLLSLVLLLAVLLAAVCFLGISTGSSGSGLAEAFHVLTNQEPRNAMAATILFQIRIPRVILAATVGAVLALGGLVFQVLLRNPLAEPYILGISGGSAVGAIVAMMAGFSLFPGVALGAFWGSMATLVLVLNLAAGRSAATKDSLLLGGVMMNAFCGAIIMFLISLTQTSQVHHILFWLMGDLSMLESNNLPVLLAVLPCFMIIALLTRPMNLLLMGQETAAAMGVNVRFVSVTLLIVTSLMVSIVVCQSGLVGFVGLVIPHIFRLILGTDHRLLAPACILGGASFLVLCDLLARILPSAGEMPVGVITALIGAPLFVSLLWRAKG